VIDQRLRALTDQATRKQRLFGGWAALAIGLLSLVMMYRHPEQLRVPAWVAYAAMSSFVSAGCALLTGEYAATRNVAPWLGVLATIGLMVPPVWIALGPGPRDCAATLSFFSTTASDWVCRGAFGFGALIGLLVLFLMVRERWRGL
jgi:formate-dependent nitrite reductase membrane component NrfD